jgi:phosphoribosylformylglycinamidine synthase
MEKRVQRCCLEAIKRGVIKSAHDCSEGGLLVAIAESCICGGIGFKGESWKVKGRLDSAFFGEHQSRVVVSISGNGVSKLSKVARRWQVPLTLLGRVGGKRLVVESYIDLPLAKVERTWWDSLKLLSGNEKTKLRAGSRQLAATSDF